MIYISLTWLITTSIAFDISFNHIPFTVIIGLIYFCDSVINFYTIRSKDHFAPEAQSLTAWQQYYIRSSLAFDIITCFPFAVFPWGKHANVFLMLHLLRVSRLSTIMGTSPIFSRLRAALEKFLGIGQAFSSIFSLVFVLCAFLHLQACFIFFFSKLEGYSNAQVKPYENASPGAQYSFALFIAVGNTFFMGYRPNTSIEQWVVIFFIILGASLVSCGVLIKICNNILILFGIKYASIVGAISSYTTSLDNSGRLYKQKMDELNDYMRWKNLDPPIKKKVFKYYEIKYRGKLFEENTLLDEMNDSLRMEIAVHNCRELIRKVSFLKREEGDGRDEQFLGRIATVLQACYFVSGDVIFSQGDIGSEMFFILQGIVSIAVNGKVVSKMKDGSVFGG